MSKIKFNEGDYVKTKESIDRHKRPRGVYFGQINEINIHKEFFGLIVDKIEYGIKIKFVDHINQTQCKYHANEEWIGHPVIISDIMWFDENEIEKISKNTINNNKKCWLCEKDLDYERVVIDDSCFNATTQVKVVNKLDGSIWQGH